MSALSSARALACAVFLGAACLPACGESEGASSVSDSAVEIRQVFKGEGFRIELRDEQNAWNEEKNARSLSGEVWLVIDPELATEQRPTMLYAQLYLDVDASGEWSEVDGGTVGILDDPLRAGKLLVRPEDSEVKLGPIQQTGVRPIDPPAWRAWVRLADGSEFGASIPAKAAL